MREREERVEREAPGVPSEPVRKEVDGLYEDLRWHDDRVGIGERGRCLRVVAVRFDEKSVQRARVSDAQLVAPGSS